MVVHNLNKFELSDSRATPDIMVAQCPFGHYFSIGECFCRATPDISGFEFSKINAFAVNIGEFIDCIFFSKFDSFSCFNSVRSIHRKQ